MNPETEMYRLISDSVHKVCEKRMLSYHIVRIESNMTNQGIPDIYCLVNGTPFWIECKYIDATSKKAELSPMQISFREQERRAQGKVYVITETNGGSLSIDYNGKLIAVGRIYEGLITRMFIHLGLAVE